MSAVADKGKLLALAAHTDGRMHALSVGLEDQIWHSEQRTAGISGAWTGWNVLSKPGDKARTLALAYHGDGRMHLVAEESPVGQAQHPAVEREDHFLCQGVLTRGVCHCSRP